jgi:hypothetical protein
VKYSHTPSSTPLYEQFSSVPISAWEEELPSMDLVIRETLRLTLCLTPLRRNISADLPMADKVVRTGAFLVYWLGDTHLNPNIYPDPYKFDPERFSEARREDLSEEYAFLGWGGGSHASPRWSNFLVTEFYTKGGTLAQVRRLQDWKSNSSLPYSLLDTSTR